MRFTKMHALGNDFVALNGYTLPAQDWRQLAIDMCDRHYGAGADGLFVALPSETADVEMRFYNPDGTEDRCGNALRCLGRFLQDEGITRKTHIAVQTFGGAVHLWIHRCEDGDCTVTVDLGPPSLAPAEIPMAWPGENALNVPVDLNGRTLTIHACSTGTPHAIVIVDELPDEETFQTVSPLIENHPFFPEKTSLEWTRFASPHRAEIRIWERAVGETLGCGTGAAAVAVIGHLLGISADPVTVVSKGGEVKAAWNGGDAVTLSGPAYIVYEADWNAG
jgi:diaminopimelate epimerase